MLGYTAHTSVIRRTGPAPAWPAPAPAPAPAPSLSPAYSSRAGRGYSSYSRPGPVVGALQLVVLLTIVTIILVKIW